ncbi:MAG: phosphoenolpyruvate--protein phosphotransferase [Kiritimatiellae bacterium]|nr:phosphoenolpyruvate--protein phosphotransferase [Kiritimatiellia bacterium]
MSTKKSNPKKEIVLQGIGVSPGLVVGPAFLMKADDKLPVARDITPEEISREVSRFEAALVTTKEQLHKIQKRVGKAMGQESASIFDAHLLVVDDRAFIEEIIRELNAKKKNIDAILEYVSEKYISALSAFEDEYLRERAADVRDVTRRILKNLAGENIKSLDQLKESCIIITPDLSPSATAMMDKNKVLGFATDIGSPTSHTAIMAKALKIPAIVGLHDVSVRVSTRDRVLIDGDKGVFILHPTQERIDQYNKVAQVRSSIQSGLSALREKPAETKDGYHLPLSANIELPEDVEAVIENGAKGIGLYRTELLYLVSEELPTEDEQATAYEEAAERLFPESVIIRTLDLGGDKFVSHIRKVPELNPFMGWRAVRFCLANLDIFKTQLRAILRASRHENVQLMYPLISNVNQVLQCNALLEETKDELRKEKIAFNEDIHVGAMIEVPSAALTADLIAPHVSFFSLGTNDLAQYTLAVDRVNEQIADLYEPTHPAIIKLIKRTIDTAHQHGIWAGICGEMAGDPFLVPLLIGLGADELSVSPTNVPKVKDIIRNVTYSESEKLASEVMKCASGKEILERCQALTRKAAPEILELID